MERRPNIHALKLLHSFSPMYFAVMITDAFFSRLAPYFNIYFSAEIVNEITGERNIDKLMTLVMITVFGNFVISIITKITSRTFQHCETRLRQREAAYFNKKVLYMDYEDLENPEVRQLRRTIAESARVNNHGRQQLLININWMTNALVDLILAMALFIEMLTLILASGEGMLVGIYVLSIICLITLNTWYNFHSGAKMSELSRKTSREMVDRNRVDNAIDCYNMGKDVRLYRQEQLIVKIQKECLEFRKKINKVRAEKTFLYGIPVLLIEIVLRIFTYVIICLYAVKGVLGIGSIIKYVNISQNMIGSIIRLFEIVANIKNNTKFVEDYLAYLDIPQRMREGGRTVAGDLKGERKGKPFRIEFRNVSFRYPSSEKYAIENVSVSFEAGEKIALVGMNGSGKTTFVKLLCRMYDPTEGQILLNGTDIRQYDYEEYLSIFSVVFQDFKLFSFSLAQNVAAGEFYDDAGIEKALIDAGFGERLAKMQNGIKTCLYKDFVKDGVEVSGGEAQKIALARALYKDAPFIILDEPTAALDPIAEYEVYSGFNRIVGDRTVVYISHRLSSCRLCERIVVFDEGHIVQAGTHEQLLNDIEGKYHELWYAQAQFYQDNTDGAVYKFIDVLS